MQSVDRQAVRERRIAVYIGAMSMLLALASLGGADADKQRSAASVEAASTWSWFQARLVRREMLRAELANLDLRILLSPEINDDARTAIKGRQAAIRVEMERLTRAPEAGDGIDDLYQRGKAIEAVRDRARRQDPFFDHSQALIQASIVLASVAIVAGGGAALWASALAGLAGAVLMSWGFLIGSPDVADLVSRLMGALAGVVVVI